MSQTPDQQTPAGDQRQPAVDEQQQPAGDQQNSTSDQQGPAGNQRQPTPNQQQLVGNQKKPAANQKEPATNQQQPATNQQQLATNQQQPATNQQQPAPKQQQLTMKQQQPAKKKQKPATNQKKPAMNQQNSSGSQPPPGPGTTPGGPVKLSKKQRQAVLAARGGGYSPRGGGCPPRGGGYTPRGGGYPPRGGGYTPRGGGCPPRGVGYAPRGRGWAPRGGGYGRGSDPHGAGPSYAPAFQPKPLKHSVSTWTAQVGEETASFVSRARWKLQRRILKGCDADSVPYLFKGYLMDERHPNEPKATYTPEELEQLCPTCGTFVIHWDTHVAGKLHSERLERSTPPWRRACVQPTEPTPMDVMAALRVLQATSPDVIAASLAAATSAKRLPPTADLPAGNPSQDQKKAVSRGEDHPRPSVGSGRLEKGPIGEQPTDPRTPPTKRLLTGESHIPVLKFPRKAPSDSGYPCTPSFLWN